MQGASQPSFPPSQGRELYVGGPPPPGAQQQYYAQQFQQQGGFDQQPKAPMQSPQPAYPPPIQQTSSMPPQQYVSQQPVGAPQMVIYQGGSGGNRNVLNKPFNPGGRREWSFGLCGCFDECGTCLLSWCCPCFSFGKNMSRLQYLESQGRPHPSGGEMCNSDCCVYLALMYCGCPCISGMGGRSKIRNRYRIDGGGCSDCMCHTFCVPCTLVQESRELGLEEHNPLPAKQG